MVTGKMSLKIGVKVAECKTTAGTKLDSGKGFKKNCEVGVVRNKQTLWYGKQNLGKSCGRRQDPERRRTNQRRSSCYYDGKDWWSDRDGLKSWKPWGQMR
jgi:hypothetical protein